jgi:hypothetical protein
VIPVPSKRNPLTVGNQIAHINAYNATVAPTRQATEVEGRALEQQVYDKLNKEAIDSVWNIEDADFAAEVFVCCPSPDIEWEDRGTVLLTGHYVILGIRQWLRHSALLREYGLTPVIE